MDNTLDSSLELGATLLQIIGTISTALVVIGFLVGVYLWIKGIAPALWRLGNGLARRKIAVFAKGDTANSLKSLLVDSSLFRDKNIYAITSAKDIRAADNCSVLIIYWPDFQEVLIQILEMKSNSTALVIYAPFDAGRIPNETMAIVGSHRNTTVTNFRGRLMNDVVTSMITTGYEKG